jgi:sporulation protein YlmC with PRC-barrel domain
LRQGELLLKDALLDKQVVDTDGAKIRRVNDLQFLKTNQGMHLVHVDVGFRGLIRRMGLIKPFDVIYKVFSTTNCPISLFRGNSYSRCIRRTCYA